jgi:hypothetical protein
MSLLLETVSSLRASVSRKAQPQKNSSVEDQDHSIKTTAHPFKPPHTGTHTCKQRMQAHTQTQTHTHTHTGCSGPEGVVVGGAEGKAASQTTLTRHAAICGSLATANARPRSAVCLEPHQPRDRVGCCDAICTTCRDTFSH